MAQDVGPLPARIEGRASDTEPFALAVNFGGGIIGPIQDVYKFQTTAPVTLVPRLSARQGVHELIGERLGPATWYIGVGAALGDMNYKLRIMPQAQ